MNILIKIFIALFKSCKTKYIPVESVKLVKDTVNATDMIRVLYPISAIITLTFLYSFSICH